MIFLQVFAALIVVITSASCSDSNMTGGFATTPKTTKRQTAENVSTKASENSSGENVSLGKTEYFQTKGNSGKVDIAWYVDQSGSMRGETANVQENFASFMMSVNEIADTRVALIAQSSGQNSISITPVADKQIQIEQRVNSRDALSIAINTFVPVGMMLPAGVRQYSNALSKLSGFFRADVPAVVVIVTDDDANGVTSANFEELSKATLGIAPKLFAFRATNDSAFKAEPGCQVAQQGVSYEQIAQSTGGEVFDICEPDWSKNFEKLKQGIAKAAQNSFSLKDLPTEIKEVKVNGAVLSKSGYSVSGNLITIAPDSIPPTGDVSIEVSYR